MAKVPARQSDDGAQDVASRMSSDNAIAVVSAYGQFRVLVVLIAVWTFFAGFALLTQSLDALTIGSGDATAERVAGSYMLMLVPVYGLIAWRRSEYRMLVWVPYAAQLAVILPTLWGIIRGDHDLSDGALMLIVSSIFFVLLAYVWIESRPLDSFQRDDIEEEPFEDEEEDDPDDGEDAEPDPEPRDGRGRRYRRS